MALSKDISLENNFGETSVFQNAYFAVHSVQATKENALVSVCVHSESKDRLLTEKFYDFTPDMDGPNFIKQAYLHLKTLPEFVGAVDV